jgi:hypothetical protein
MGFSWSLALANRLHLNLDDEMWKRFPGCCPHCSDIPCRCQDDPDRKAIIPPIIAEGIVDERSITSVRADRSFISERPATLSEYQAMLRRIYPNNTLQDAAMHLAEETGELDESLGFYMGTHHTILFEEINGVLVDTVTLFCAVASCIGLNLADETGAIFLSGCPKCHKIPCNCGYSTAKSIGIH